MGDEDGIVVTKDEDSISIVDGEDEYLVKLNEEIENEMKDEKVFYEWLNEDEASDAMDELDADFPNIKDIMNLDDEEHDKEAAEDDYEHIKDLEMDAHDDKEDEGEMEEAIYELHMGDDPEMAEAAFDANPMEGVDVELAEIVKELEMEGMYHEENDPVYEIMMDEDDLEEGDCQEGNCSEDADMEEEYLEEAKKRKKRKKSSVSRKGRTGNGPKFSYKKENVFFKSGPKQKEGKKTMGTGKPKYSWKAEVNMEGFTEKAKEMKEASRTYGAGSKKGRGLRKGITPNRNLTFESVNSEVKVLREKNEEYRSALNMFITKLNEFAIFNYNLAYATRLFTEHSTTKQEKINILRRFDNVETLKESKNLYKSIKNELSNGNSGESTQINESIERVVSKSPSNGSAASLIESKTYENPQFLRMKDLMGKM